jgi:hypothetical protein
MNMNVRPENVKKLEAKLAEILRDRQLVAEESGTKANRAALAEYEKMSQDANIPAGIRYLALHCIADKNEFYNDPRDKSQMVATVSQVMGSLVPGDVVKAIECLKTQYSSIYQLDESFFDRYEAHAVEFMTRVPIDRHDKTVAENKDTQLNPVPISTTRLPTSPPPQPVAPAVISTPLITQTPNYEQAVNSHNDSSPTQVNPRMDRVETPMQNANKGAFIIAGAIIVGSIVFSTSLMSSRNPSQINKDKSVSLTKSDFLTSLGWLRLGSVNNTNGSASAGEKLIRTTQAITIAPSEVPKKGDRVTIINSVNLRADVPQPPNYRLTEMKGIISPGKEVIIIEVTSFVDSTSSSQYTAVWAKIGVSKDP